MYFEKFSFLNIITAVSITIIFFEPKPVFSQDDQQYLTCNGTRFDCGNNIINLGYPFWGTNRPKYCGHPAFRLNCPEDGVDPMITLNSITYRVLNISQPTRTLTIYDADFSATLCPDDPKNATSSSDLFRYASDTQNLTLLNNCQTASLPIMLLQRFNCSSSDDSNNYFVTQTFVENPDFAIPNCESRVDVRVSSATAATVTIPLIQSDHLKREINSGFKIEWTASRSMCDQCVASEGVCGSNNSTEEFVCYCRNEPNNPLACRSGSSPGPSTTARNDGNGRTSTAVGLYIAGACILGMFIGGITYYFIQRKKRRAAMAKSVDLSTPPSSKGNIVPSTNYSRTTESASSYTTFSKSDIEKGSTYFGAQIFSYTELEEATANFDASRELGEGGFGTVYYGELHDGRAVAVKRLYENNFKRVEQFMNEIEILTRLQHRNLVKLYGCTTRRSRELLLVYEFVSNGTVADHLHGSKSNSASLNWQVRLSIALETAEALTYLHRTDIIHRDVKTNNILLDDKFRVKVADFGLSKLFPTDVTHVSTAPQGTPGYVDPEYYQCYQLTTKSDVYSFGVVLIELISSLQAVDTNRHRHDINLSNMAVSKIQNHLVGDLVDPSLGFDSDEEVRRMATDVAELAFRCLQQERDMRPSMEEVSAALRAIQRNDKYSEQPEVVDIRSEDVGLLRNLPPPLSPDSAGTEKWASNTTTPNSY